MATGQSSFSTSGQQVIKRAVYPPGTYRWAIDGPSAEVRQKQEEGAVPYVNVKLKLVGETREDGSPVKYSIYKRFFLNLDPGSDGVLMPNRADGLVAFAKAVGQDVEVPIVKLPKKMKSGQMQTIDALDARAVCRWLKDLDGAEFTARIKTVKNLAGDDDSELAEFVQGEEPAPLPEEVSTPDEGEAPAEESAEAPEETEETEETPAEEPFEPVPEPKPAKAKPAAKPAPKVVARRK